MRRLSMFASVFFLLTSWQLAGCGETTNKVPATVVSPRADGESTTSRAKSAIDTDFRPARQDELVRALGGEEVVALLRNPDRVEAVLLKTPAAPQTTPAHKYVPSTDAVAVDAVVASHAVELLLDEQLHRVTPEGVAKSCYPVWGVRLSFWKAKEKVDVYLCFMCEDVAVYWRGKQVPWANVRFVVRSLLDDALKIFPDYPALNQFSASRKDRFAKPTQDQSPESRAD